jgi:NADH:ubiquinone oxidoreductase subunit H
MQYNGGWESTADESNRIETRIMPVKRRFTIGHLLLITTVVAVAAGVAAALMRREIDRSLVMIWGVALPMGLLIAIAMASDLWRRR